MVAELLRDFVAGPWLDDLDLERMERQNAKSMPRRANAGRRHDLAYPAARWRRHLPGVAAGVPVHLLSLDGAPRAVYAGLLWQQLQDEKRLLPTQAAADPAGRPVQR